MPEPAEAAIELALLEKATAFAAAQSLTLDVANGNAVFAQPEALPTSQWLRVAIIPAPTMASAIGFDSYNLHYGLMQIDIMQGLGGGTVAMKRLVAAISAYFPMGLTLTKDGFDIRIMSHTRNQVVTTGPLLLDAPWMMIPVSIPYRCFDKPA
jgi:hypothetical protein